MGTDRHGVPSTLGENHGKDSSQREKAGQAGGQDRETRGPGRPQDREAQNQVSGRGLSRQRSQGRGSSENRPCFCSSAIPRCLPALAARRDSSRPRCDRSSLQTGKNDRPPSISLRPFIPISPPSVFLWRRRAFRRTGGPPAARTSRPDAPALRGCRPPRYPRDPGPRCDRPGAPSPGGAR